MVMEPSFFPLTTSLSALRRISKCAGCTSYDVQMYRSFQKCSATKQLVSPGRDIMFCHIRPLSPRVSAYKPFEIFCSGV
jgi:hypothetical protein